MDIDDLSVIGKRLRIIRQRRGKSLEVVAGLAGMSMGHLSEIERGFYTPRIEHLLALADVLGVSPSDLAQLPFPSPGKSYIDSTIQAVRLAILAAAHGYPDGQVCSVDELRERVNALLKTFFHECDLHTAIPHQLSLLIHDMHTSIKYGQGVSELLDLAIILHTHITLRWLRLAGASADLRTQVASLVGIVARERNTPDAIGLATYAGMYTLVITGAANTAYHEMHTAMSQAMSPELTGILALSQSYLASVTGCHADVNATLEMAQDISTQTGESDKYWLGFGPAAVAQWSCAVLTEAGDYERAVHVVDRLNLDIHPFRLLQADGRVMSALTLARFKHRRMDAVMELKRAENIYPLVVQRNQLARDLLASLITHARNDAIGEELRKMAYRAGISLCSDPLPNTYPTG